jgi:hypothetical protein
VPSLRETELRVAFLRSELERGQVDDVAVALDELCGQAEQADPRAREVLTATVTALHDPALAERIDTLRELASERGLLSLGRMLRRRASQTSPPPPPDDDDRRLITSRTGRVLTLGERKSLARQPTRAMLDKLIRDPHPQVIRMLLASPRITETDVMRMAASRPAYPEVIGEIARSPRWATRIRVRMAIVQNPGSPPDIAVPLLRLLIRPELAQVVAAADVPAIVRAAAAELLERRPPVPEKGGAGQRPQ